jgi:hypothetical protein
MNVRIRKLGCGHGRSYKNINCVTGFLPNPKFSWMQDYGNEIVVTFVNSVSIKKEKNNLIITEKMEK